MAEINGNKPPSFFSRFAKWTSKQTGRPITFILAAGIIIVWAVTGPMFDYSDTWQLVINTGTTIVTFLMVFLIQNTQNRDSQAVQVKLDEIIRAMEGAKNELLDLEELDDEDLREVHEEFLEMAKEAREEITEKKEELEKVKEEIKEEKAELQRG